MAVYVHTAWIILHLLQQYCTYMVACALVEAAVVLVRDASASKLTASVAVFLTLVLIVVCYPLQGATHQLQSAVHL